MLESLIVKHALRIIINLIVFPLQVSLLLLSYTIFSALNIRPARRKNWAVGTDEVAAYVNNISTALGDAVSVNMSPHPFYSYNYDHDLPARINWGYLRYIIRIFYSPVLLGYLCHRVEGFFYVGGASYLIPDLDGRRFEFHFLKSRGFKIVCFFCGSEIRSLRLMSQLSRDMARDVISTYQNIAIRNFDSDELESYRMKLAASADNYADHIFSSPVDQISYLRRAVHPFIYFHAESQFLRNDGKFSKLDRVKVLHGPSSPLIKGTPLVRAAIKRLQVEGYDFEYRELIGVSNEAMLNALAEAHVVLNEFYGFVPGQFGVEAMASHCALMTSADKRIETTLPAGANAAWMVTEYWNIYDNLKRLLDDHALIKQFADAGFSWASENCSYKKSAVRLKTLLDTEVTSAHD